MVPSLSEPRHSGPGLVHTEAVSPASLHTATSAMTEPQRIVSGPRAGEPPGRVHLGMAPINDLGLSYAAVPPPGLSTALWVCFAVVVMAGLPILGLIALTIMLSDPGY